MHTYVLTSIQPPTHPSTHTYIDPPNASGYAADHTAPVSKCPIGCGIWCVGYGALGMVGRAGAARDDADPRSAPVLVLRSYFPVVAFMEGDIGHNECFTGPLFVPVLHTRAFAVWRLYIGVAATTGLLRAPSWPTYCWRDQICLCGVYEGGIAAAYIIHKRHPAN